MPRVDTVKDYLQEIASHPLLTATEEVALSRQVQEMMTLLEQRKRLELQLQRAASDTEFSQSTGKSEAEIRSILQQGQQAKNRMVVANLRFVVSIAKKYQNRQVEFLDLIQEGTLGLNRGVEKFDPGKGYKLSTYAYWWITQSITRCIADKSRTIRLPIHLSEALNKIRKHEQELAQVLKRTPTIAEIAASTGFSTDRIRKYMQYSRSPISLEVKIGKNRDTDLAEVLPIPDEKLPSHVLDQQILLSGINSILNSLTPIQRQVIILRYGLSDGKELTLAEIAVILRLSKKQVRQIQYQAIAILRNKKDYIKRCLD